MLDITTQGFPHMYDFIGDTAAKGANPVVLVVLTVIIMMYYLLFSYLGSVGTPSTPVPSSPGMTFFEIMLWGVFVFLILINGLQYFFQVDIKTSIKNLFTPIPEIDIAVTTPPDQITEDDKYIDDSGEIVPEIMRHKQVFHVPDNKYTYNDAKAVCAAYGAKLADYSQVESAYKNGAEWCGYGWSANQMALYPTQKTTWDGLQKIEGHEHDCGRPGINGGYIANENVRFGANCYGYKPKITELEREIMENQRVFPMTKKERQFEEKVNEFRQKLPDILVSPFNYNKWSQV
jgi:hypothetical protein